MRFNAAFLDVTTSKLILLRRFSMVFPNTMENNRKRINFEIKIPTDYYLINPVVLLEEAFRSFKDIITKHLYDHTKKLKYIMSAHVIFQQGVDPEIKTEPPVVLTVNPVTVYIATDLDKELQESAREMMVLMENYEGVGSGWVYDYITRLDISLNSF